VQSVANWSGFLARPSAPSPPARSRCRAWCVQTRPRHLRARSPARSPPATAMAFRFEYGVHGEPARDMQVYVKHLDTFASGG
jgi:hypothetical protein